MRCYIAGPMRGRGLEVVTARFARAAARLQAVGWEPLVPSAEEPYDTDRDVRVTVRRDLGMILSLRRDEGDAVVVLPGHELSVGAIAEVAVARWLGIRVLTLEEAVEEKASMELCK